jgi:hypothetical protein
MIISAIEAIGNTALFIMTAERYAYMGVMKDLVRVFTDSPDFRSYAVSIAMDAIWNLVEAKTLLLLWLQTKLLSLPLESHLKM